ncbi:MAG: alpha/beta hydrolase [Verrucomicrobiota bacterium JB023]|nr:alpha/beta hydrolase [Verrucomicrobiota bacterium JB023]
MSSWLPIPLLSLFAATLLTGADAPLTPDETVIYKEVDGHKLRLEIFYPEDHSKEDTRPAAVFFFGGGWNGGKTSQFHPHCQHLAEQGMVAISADYRVKSRHGTPPSKCVEDGKSAIVWIREHAGDLGIDPSRLAAGGGSAGGQVAAATGTATAIESEESKGKNSRPNALLLFNPVADNGPDGYGYDRVKAYWQDFSPYHNIDKQTPPTIIFLGTKDHLIPVEVGENFKEAMEAKGLRCELHLFEGQGHGFFNLKKSQKNYEKTITLMDEFLASLGYIDSRD